MSNQETKNTIETETQTTKKEEKKEEEKETEQKEETEQQDEKETKTTEKKEKTKKKSTETQQTKLVQTIQNMIEKEDLKKIMTFQKHSFNNVKDTNEALTKFNKFSSEEFSELKNNFVYYAKTLVQMKKDLSYCYKKIGNMKKKIQDEYQITPSLIRSTLENKKTNIN
ncbi:hypothetical protein M0812_18771 [Anaeramoeba flamelloides]|uniref:KxDL domain-containing protein n=1 Tax=Anaeramoeba flamelloides TaxID=1746091 RepID=A0AAV7Z3N9_9EUKA|nr:hypothetical protein M0812_18771 [Anaeramoeba flamelloides]